MLKVEGLYLPRPEVKKNRQKINTKNAIALIEGTNIHKDLKEELISDPSIKWAIERWPISLMRMTGIYGENNDPMNVAELMEKAAKRFELFAQHLMRRPDILSSYPKFSLDRWESHLPIVGVRGKTVNHIVDGHHRTTRAVWRGEKTMTTLTAYKPFSISIS